MKQRFLYGLLGVVLLGCTSSAYSLVMMLPLPQRVAQANTVVVGKVLRFEDKNIKAERYVGDKQTAEYQIALVKISDPLVGAKGVTIIRVGAPVPPPPQPRVPGRPIISSPRYRGPKLTADVNYLLFLRPHHKQNFYIMPNFGDAVQIPKGTDPKAHAEVKKVKRYTDLLNDPIKHLKSKSDQARLETAYLLLFKYRMRTTPKTKEVPVNAETSKLILQALLAADWSIKPQRFGQPNALQAFNMLQLQPKDGWKRPRDYKQMPTLAVNWLKKNVDSYRIKKFVPVTKKAE